MTFVELQNHMNLKKQAGQQVKYTYRSAEQILQTFKTLDSGWEIALNDEIVTVANRIFIQSIAEVTDGTDKRSSRAFAELADVPVLNTQKGERKQMSEHSGLEPLAVTHESMHYRDCLELLILMLMS